jgi:hypothetical protein
MLWRIEGVSEGRVTHIATLNNEGLRMYHEMIKGRPFLQANEFTARYYTPIRKEKAPCFGKLN